jgi:KaiC/GvpD/RAD55 family RecA-like ATPase
VLAQLQARFRASVWSGIDLDLEKWWTRLEAEFAARPPQVVVFDPFSKLTGANLKDPHEVRAVLNRVDALRRRFAFVVLLVHHYRKGQGERIGRGSQELFGSFVLSAWAEQSFFVEPKDRSGKLVTVTLQSKDIEAPDPLGVVIVETADAITLTLEELPTTAGVAERVWEALGTAPPTEPHKACRGSAS